MPIVAIANVSTIREANVKQVVILQVCFKTCNEETKVRSSDVCEELCAECVV
ncbi:hypothetical protein HMPREF1584_00232 [Gardnerella vaginalis JCP8481A]|nr:hypothetical protein HMPREF1585_01164 [Gardnerella vaginalis JCP8481B]EPI44465.1 hypothetical protein HMPREF1584_00232 [Gardnerella vaginalis JCP8481A]